MGRSIAFFAPILITLLLASACADGEQLAGAPTKDRIAFNSCPRAEREGEAYTCHISVINADGSGLRKLTKADEARGAPAWSPDGRRLALVTESQIAVVNADGSDLTELTHGETALDSPAWSPDGTRIAFGGGVFAEIHLMNADGSGGTNLTQTSPLVANEYSFAWSPDGNRIAFAAESGGYHEIYIMGADGSRRTQLTRFNAPNARLGGPTWSPDNERIAFSFCPYEEACPLYVASADGSELTELSQGAGSLSWSPDGTRIAFERNRQISVINPDGSGLSHLTKDGGFGPAWSPDSSRIAFVKQPGENADIYVMNADGSRLTRLTDNSEYESGLTWQPRP